MYGRLSVIDQIFPPEPPHIGPSYGEFPVCAEIFLQSGRGVGRAGKRTARFPAGNIGNPPVTANHIGRRIGHETGPYAAAAQELLQAVSLEHGAKIIRAVEGEDSNPGILFFHVLPPSQPVLLIIPGRLPKVNGSSCRRIWRGALKYCSIFLSCLIAACINLWYSKSKSDTNYITIRKETTLWAKERTSGSGYTYS